MKKSKQSEIAPLEGEVLPPAHVSVASTAEISPAEFLMLHGIPVPRRVKVYGSFDAAVRGVIADVSKG